MLLLLLLLGKGMLFDSSVFCVFVDDLYDLWTHQRRGKLQHFLIFLRSSNRICRNAFFTNPSWNLVEEREKLPAPRFAQLKKYARHTHV